MAADSPALASTPKRPIGRSVFLLVAAQALFITSHNVNMIIVGLAGLVLAPYPWLATLPLSLMFICAMLSALPASLAMGRWGRKPIFLFGVACTCLGMFGHGWALVQGSFLLFVCASCLFGISYGIAQFYRYAATDSVPQSYKPRALSLVLVGGLVAAFVGPELMQLTFQAVPQVLYAGSFFAIALLQMVAFVVILCTSFPKVSVERVAVASRPMRAFFTNPRFIAGLMAASVGYAVMTFMMTATPLEIVHVSHLGDLANAQVIQWHVVAMYAPSFFTSGLIRRFGVQWVLGMGLLLYVITVGIALSGQHFWHYFLALFCLGIGWNMLYVGGSSIIVAIATPGERARVQGVSDCIILLSVAIASLCGGAIHYLLGWQSMALLLLVPIGLIGVAVLSMVWHEQRALP